MREGEEREMREGEGEEREMREGEERDMREGEGVKRQVLHVTHVAGLRQTVKG